MIARPFFMSLFTQPQCTQPERVGGLYQRRGASCPTLEVGDEDGDGCAGEG